MPAVGAPAQMVRLHTPPYRCYSMFAAVWLPVGRSVHVLTTQNLRHSCVYVNA